MNMIWKSLVAGGILCVSSTPLLAQGGPAGASMAGEMYSVARGGRLYDKWFKENGARRPNVANPAYPAAGGASGKKGADWRCKECHGWDYIGAKGAYAKGKHHTGYPGVEGAYEITPAQMIDVLSDRSHGYNASMLSKRDVEDLTAFVSKGVFDADFYIDRQSRLAKGDPGSGKQYYQTICAGCHDLNGKGEDTPPLGAIAWENPWEALHKILNGQPGEEMPALRALGIQPAVDILAYMQTGLPRR